MKLFSELRRRNVIRVGAAYLLSSWALLQVVDVVAPILELPDWAPKLVFLILAVGLVPALVFAWVFEITPDGLRREVEDDESPPPSARFATRKLNYVIIGSLAAAVLLLLVERQMIERPTSEPESATEVTATESGAEPSIAVLPFVNMSSDPEQDYFSDGITEEILNVLAGVDGLKVAGRTSSFAFKGKNDDLRRIGDALGVEHILEGSVRKAGDTVRITAQLVQVDDGFHLWSDTYDRKLDDVFAIQDEIAVSILKELRSTLISDGDPAVSEAARTSPDVYSLYLRARERIYTRTRAEIETAIEELDEAIRLDPQYAPAYAQRGIATMLLATTQYGDIPVDEANRRGKRFVDIALELDPELAEAWAALGLYESRDGAANTEAAIDALVRALDLNPNLIDASNWLHIALRDAGDFNGAIEILENLVERDPLYRPAFSNAIQAFNAKGQYEKADELIRRIESFDPDNPDILMARATRAMFSGQAGEGMRLMEQRRELGNMSGVAKVYFSLGLVVTAQFERAAEEASPFWQPNALYEIGREDEAFELAYTQAREGFPGNLFYLFVRSGRFQDLVDYVEERWPSLEAFAEEYPGQDTGYDIMLNIATAYDRAGRQEQLAEALAIVDRWFANLADAGVDNYVLDSSKATLLVLKGENDAALDALERAAEEGFSFVGDPDEVVPALSALADDPRFAEIEATMLATTNRDRAVVGLPPVGEDYRVASTGDVLHSPD